MTREDAHKLWHKDSWQIAGKIYHKYVDKIYDDFEKELDKKQREYYTIGSNDCHNAMKESFSIKSITNGYDCGNCNNNHLGYDSYTCVNCQEFYFKNWEKQDER